jgi:hypothetical protein
LQKAAADVEYLLTDGKNALTPEGGHLSLLETELNAVLEELSPLLSEAAAAKPQTEPLDAEKARELIEKLEPLLKSGSPDCLELIDDLHALPESEELIEQIEDFEFKQAAVTLAELKKRLV